MLTSITGERDSAKLGVLFDRVSCLGVASATNGAQVYECVMAEIDAVDNGISAYDVSISPK